MLLTVAPWINLALHSAGLQGSASKAARLARDASVILGGVLRGRVRFIFLYFVVLPPTVWWAFYGAASLYGLVFGQGDVNSSSVFAWGSLVVYLATLGLSWRDVVRRLRQPTLPNVASSDPHD